MNLLNNINTLFFDHHKYIKITKFYGEERIKKVNKFNIDSGIS